MRTRFPRRAAARKESKLPARLFVRESDIQQAVTEFLQYDGWWAMRTEHAVEWSGPESGAPRFKRRVGEVGMPDYQYVRHPRVPVRSLNCQLMWIEFKRPGEKLSSDQVAWHVAARMRGAFVLVVSDIDQFIAWYTTSGLYRRALT